MGTFHLLYNSAKRKIGCLRLEVLQNILIKIRSGILFKIYHCANKACLKRDNFVFNQKCQLNQIKILMFLQILDR